MLHDETGERDGQVVTEPFLADLGSYGLAVATGKILTCKGIPRIEDTEKELVAFFAVFSQQCRKIFHGGRLDTGISECLEDGAYRIEYVLPFRALARKEIPRTFGNGRFLCHISSICF